MSSELRLKANGVSYFFPLDRVYWGGDHGHTWALETEPGNFKIGFDFFGQQQAGKILLIRTRGVGKSVKQGKTLGTIETGKWIGGMRSPFTGTIIDINREVVDKPDLINTDPYESWVVLLKVENPEEEQSHENFIHLGDSEKLKSYILKEFERFALSLESD